MTDEEFSDTDLQTGTQTKKKYGSMANLGNLWFSVGLKDETDKDWEKIVKRVEQRGAKLGLSVDGQKLQQEINAAIAGKKYTIDLSVAVKDNQVEAAIRNAYNRMNGIGATAADVRRSRIDTNYMRADAYSKAQSQLERSRKALADLREARLRDAEAARQQRAANDAFGKSVSRTGGIIGSLRNEIGNLYSVYTIQSFLGSLIQVGGEFQKQHIALEAMLGDAAKADTIFSQIKQLAVESPFNFQNLTGYAKQLAAFSIPYEELYDTTKRLADISAGLGVDMSRIILAYGQVRSAEFLKGTELRQFTEAGIPLLQQLSDKFTELEGRVVSVGEVFNKISMREVPFQMVKDVLWDLTNEGGQFYQMQEVLTESLSGKLDKLKDSYQIMLSTMADSNNSLIGGGLDLLTELTGHWQGFLNVLESAVAAWGAYKAAVFLANAADAIKVARLLSVTKGLNANTIATAMNARAQNGAAAGGLVLLRNLMNLKKAMSGIAAAAGPWGILISALAAIGAYAYNAWEEANRLRKELEETASKGAMAYESAADDLDLLVDRLGKAVKGSQEYNDTISTIQSRYGDYLGNIRAEADAYEYLKGKIDEVKQAMLNRAKADFETSAMGKINEEYMDDLQDSVDSLKENLQEELGISESQANTLARAIRERIQEAVRNGLKPNEINYDEYKGKIESLLSEFNIDAEIKPSHVMILEGGVEKRVGGITDTIDEISRLAGVYNDLADAQAMAKEQSELYFSEGISNGKIIQLQKAYEAALPNLTDAEKEEAYLKLLDAKIAVYKELGDISSANRLEAEKKAIESLGDSWYKVAHDMQAERKAEGKVPVSEGLLPTVKEGQSGNQIAYYEKLAEAAYNAKSTIDRLSLVPEKEMTESTRDALESAKATLEFVEDYQKMTGIDIQSFGKTKKVRGDGGTDEFAEKMRERISLIKDAYNEYKKWEELVGRAEAIGKMRSAEVFAPLFENGSFDPSEYKKNILAVIDEVNKAGAGNKERRDVLKEAYKLVYDIDGNSLRDGLDRALEDAERYLQGTVKKWDLFKGLFEATGERDLSMNITFGKDFKDSVNSFDDAIKSAFDSIMESKWMPFTFQSISDGEIGNVPKKVLKLYESVKKQIDDYHEEELGQLAGILEEYQTNKGKIIAIEQDAAEKIALIRKKMNDGSISQPRGESLIHAIEADANYEKFKLSSDYLKFFSAIYSLTRAEAQKIGDAIKLNLDERMQEGAMSAEEYAEEVGRIREQIEKLNNLNGDFGSFMSGGLEGLFEKRREKGESDFSAGAIDYKKAAEDYAAAMDSGDEAAMNAAKANMDSANAMMSAGKSAMQGANGALATLSIVSAIVHGINDAIQGITDAVGKISDTMEAYGKDTGPNTGIGKLEAGLKIMSEASQEATSAFDSLMKGDIGGVISGVVGSFTSWFKGFAELHDAKLEDKIEKLRLEYEKLEALYDEVERGIERGLGGSHDIRIVDAENEMRALDIINKKLSSLSGNKLVLFKARLDEEEYEKLQKRVAAYETGGAYGYQRQIMEEQLANLEEQLEKEEDKKNTDESAVQDYKNQIAELKDDIRYLSEDVAAELYGIDFKSWAAQIGDALYDAWQKGIDGAEAFDNAVGDIMGNVMNKLLTVGILEPMFEDIRIWAFGEDGKSGAFGEDHEFDQGELVELLDMIMPIKSAVDDYNEDMDELNELALERGIDLRELDDDSDSGLSAGIQSITEDTAGILASYLNAIRADVSINKEALARIEKAIPQGLNIIAQSQLRQLEAISANTKRNADSAAAILTLLQRNVNGVNKFHI